MPMVNQITRSPGLLNFNRFSPHTFHLDEKIEVFAAEGSLNHESPGLIREGIMTVFALLICDVNLLQKLMKSILLYTNVFNENVVFSHSDQPSSQEPEQRALTSGYVYF